jgi:cystathionine gamma-synthase
MKHTTSPPNQMSGCFGVVVSLDVRGAATQPSTSSIPLKLWYLATSLGGVESTVSYPVLSSHSNVPQRQRKLLGVSPATIRLSLESNKQSIFIADLDQVFSQPLPPEA